MTDLHLNLKGEYFDAIKSGEKLFEYRLLEKWERRIKGKQFDRVLLKRGYPKRDDANRIIIRPWMGYEVLTISHPHFGPLPVQVLAIRVN